MAFDAGTGFIDILPRINPATFAAAANAQITPAMARLTGGLRQSASALGASIGAPLAIAAGAGGVAAIGKLTIQFEDAFTRIAAVSNASTEQISRWRQEVFALAKETAIAPQDLGEGLFFLASAGLKANQIFPALRASAQAAAVGLGEMGDLARITANVLNAYPEAGLKAADALDVITAAVRESTAEPDEFADAMGRLLPIASKAEVSFDELAASLATLSNIGLDVDEGVTGVRQVLNAIVAPGKQAADTMNEIGLSTEQLRRSLAEDGLIATLRLLDEASGGSIDTLRKIIPNIRAMTAAFGLTEQELRKVDGIFDRVKNSTGDLGDALEETQAGPGFRFRQTMVDLQTAAIRLGQVLLPVATSVGSAFSAILGPITSVLEVMADIPGITTAITVALGGFLAVKFLPPLLLAISRGLQAMNLAAAASGALDLGIALGTLGRVAITTAAPLALIPAAVFKLAEVTGRRQEEAFTGLKNHIVDVGVVAAEADGSLQQLRRSVAAQHGVGFRLPTTTEQREEIARDFDRIAGSLDKQSRAAAIAETNLEEFDHQLRDLGQGLAPAARSIAALTDKTFPEFSRELRTALAEGQTNVGKWKDFVADTMGDAAKAFQDFHDEAFENLDFTTAALGELSAAATSAQEELATASGLTAEAMAELRSEANLTPEELLRGLREATRETRDFGRDLLEISRIGGAAGEAAAEALLAMGDSGRAAAESIADAGPRMQEKLVGALAAGQGAAEDLATRLTRRIVGTLEDIREILDALAVAWGITVETEGAEESKTKLDLILHRMREIDGTVATATVTTIFREQGAPPGYDPRQIDNAEGGIINARQGFITRGPTIFRAGESRKGTRFGVGTEIVQPLDDKGISIMAKAFRLAMDEAGGGGDVHVTVELDGERVGRVLARRGARRRELVGATA